MNSPAAAAASTERLGVGVLGTGMRVVRLALLAVLVIVVFVIAALVLGVFRFSLTHRPSMPSRRRAGRRGR